MKKTLHFLTLLIASTTFLFAQDGHDHFLCGTVVEPNATFSFSDNSAYSGSVDPEYLASFEPISFDIYFWIVKPSSENIPYVPITYQHIIENLKRTNNIFKPLGICFVLKGYDFFENDAIYKGSYMSQIVNYANNNGKVSVNAFNVYVVDSLAQGNGVTNFEGDKLAIKRSHFIGNNQDVSPGNVLAHELAHDFNLMHPWGVANGTTVTAEHVTRDPNDPNYNALTHGDLIHDTPAMVSFWNEANLFENTTIFDIIDVNTCNYTGSLTDALGVPFQLTPTDVGNVMGYTWQPCITTGFTVGQGIRIREYIADPYNANKPPLLAKRNNTTAIDLYLKDSPEDFGVEPNTVTVNPWTSPDIWVRHQEDYVYQHQNPEYYNETNTNYVHVRITNRGCQSSSGNEKIKLYWSKAATSLSWDYHWNDANTFENGAKVGGEIATITLPVIDSQESIVIAYPWNVPNPKEYEVINENPWHFCLLARIVTDNDPMTFPEVTQLSQNVRNNNNVAQRNITIIDLVNNAYGKAIKIGGVIGVGSVHDFPMCYSLEFATDDGPTGKKLFEEAEVSIDLDPGLFKIWEENGGHSEGISLERDGRLIVKKEGAVLKNLCFNPKEIKTLNLSFNFLTKEITDKHEYTYHVIQRDEQGNVIGGETYEIKKTPRELFYAKTEDKTSDKNTFVTLSAEVINEPALYNWYDTEGNLIYEGIDFVTSVESGKKYKLEIIALADGYKDYVETEIKLNPNNVKMLYPNPTSSSVTVDYKINQGETAYLSVVSMYSSTDLTSNNYILDVDSDTITIDLNNYSEGLYAVILVVNGEISDVKTLIKE